MKTHRAKRTRGKAVLNTVAESIGSALGTLAAKAHAAKRALTHSSAVHSVERKTKKLMANGKNAARKTRHNLAAKLNRSKLAKATRNRLLHGISSAERAGRRASAKVRAARRARMRP